MKKLVQRLAKAFQNSFVSIDICHKQHVRDTYECVYQIYIANHVNIMYIKSIDEMKEKVNQIIKEQNEINRRTKVTE